MNVLAIVTACGDAPLLPRRHRLPLAGAPLAVHSVRQARAARCVSEVAVLTDDPEVAAACLRAGAALAASASTGADSESALLDLLDQRRRAGRPEPKLVLVLDAAAPLRRPGDLDRAADQFRESGADALISVGRVHGPLWRETPAGVQPWNADDASLDDVSAGGASAPLWQENGSFYFCRPELLHAARRRARQVAVYEMDAGSCLRVDSPTELELCRSQLRRPEYAAPAPWPDPLRLVVFDFDGVMTDNRVWVDAEGRESVACNRSDGWGLGRLRAAGLPLLVLSTEPNPVVAARCAKLHLPCRHDLADKAAALREELASRGVAPAETVFVGNDANDLECLQLAGLAVVPADAHPSVLPAAGLVLESRGGHGAVREVCDLLLAELARREPAAAAASDSAGGSPPDRAPHAT